VLIASRDPIVINSDYDNSDWLSVSHVSQRPGLSHVEPTETQAQTPLALHCYSSLLVLFIVCFIVCNKMIWIFN